MYLANVTQYLLPNGRTRDEAIELPEDTKAFYNDATLNGLCFEAEILTTGQVSITLVGEDTDDNDPTVDIEIVRNGPEVREAFIRILNRQKWRKK